MAISGASAPQHVARCEVLMSAGLFEEALALAKQIAEYNEQNRDVEHQANALLVAAHAALYAGRTGEAAELSDRAVSVLMAADSPSLALEARWVALEAQHAEAGASEQLLAEAIRIADALEADGLRVAAGHARLLAGRMAVELGEAGMAVGLLGDVAAVRQGPVELRLQARLAAALMRLEEGNTRGASAAVRSGFDLLDRYQQALGATELRMGIERHGTELGEIGLRLAIDSGRARRILEWMERTRAGALRFAPVSPSEDDEVRQLLGQLRQVDAELRDPSKRTPDLVRQRRSLQDEIARSERTKRAELAHRAESNVGELVDAVGSTCLVELGAGGDQLHAVVVNDGRVRHVPIGPAADVLDELRHVRFAMRRAARRGRSLDADVLDRLESATLGSVPLPADRVVVVPPPALMALPWAALPSMRGRQVTVSPSANLWWQARGHPSSTGETVVAGGPDLEHAAAEVAAICHIYPLAKGMPPGVGVEEVRNCIDGAAVAHIVSHATFSVENPMFSSLRLGDGDLNVYDIERLGRSPHLVVLSACDSGYSETRSGDELAGLTSALLSMGTRTVVASVGLVPDTTATSDLMVDFHHGLVDGLEPAAALARAQENAWDDPERFISAASFVCVGA